MLGEQYASTKSSVAAGEEIERSGSRGASSIEDEELSSRRYSRSRSRFMPLSRLLTIMSSRRRSGNHAYDYHAAPTEEFADDGPKFEQPFEGRRWHKSRKIRLLKKAALYLPLAVLVFFGLVHIIMVILGRKSLFWDIEEYEQYLPNFGKPGHVGEDLAHYPTDATKDILPIPCHSHNDYWRRVPLFDAIHAGCISVEADVWLFEDSDKLYVGHGTSSLTQDRTLASLYVDPLVELLDKMNPNTEFEETTGHGVFDEDPDQTLVLLIDFKTDGHELFPHVRKQLEPLRKRGYLSHWDGDKFNSRAVTVVGTGNTPFDLIVENKSYRDIFFDAPIDELWEDPTDGTNTPPAPGSKIKGRGQGKTGTGDISANDLNISNSYYASTSMQKAIGIPWSGELSDHQMSLLRGQIKGAQRRGLKVRYWETPFWPTSLMYHVWSMLVEEGADILNVDDLQAAAKLDWTIPVRHNWIDA